MPKDRVLKSGGVEGNQVPESGPSGADIANLTHKYREVYQNCVQEIDKCSNDTAKELLNPLKKVMSDVWEQNKMLQDYCHDLEQSANRQMEKMGRRLDQSTPLEGNSAQERINDESADIETLLKILKEMVLKSDVTLDDYEFRTINREDVEKSLNQGKNFERSMPFNGDDFKTSSPIIDGIDLRNAEDNDGFFGGKEDLMNETEYFTLEQGAKNLDDNDLKNDGENCNCVPESKPVREKEEFRNDGGFCSCEQESKAVGKIEEFRNDGGYCACEKEATDDGVFCVKIPCSEGQHEVRFEILCGKFNKLK